MSLGEGRGNVVQCKICYCRKPEEAYLDEEGTDEFEDCWGIVGHQVLPDIVRSSHDE